MSKRKHNTKELKVDAMKMKNEKTDPFLCLPAELLLYILDRLDDLKSLCRCSIVSKHFASVIAHVQTVSYNVPCSGTLSRESYDSMYTLRRELDLASGEQIPAVLEFLSRQNLKLPMFLDKLRELKSIHLEYTHPKNGAHTPYPKWKVRFDDSNAKLESFVTLITHSVRKETDDDPNPEQEVSRELIRTQIQTGFWLPVLRYVEWICLICMLVKNHTSLRMVTITDSEKQSKLVMRDEQLVKLSCNVIVELLDKPWSVPSTVNVALVPLVHLPLSGYVMSWAFMTMITCANSKNVGEMTSLEFEDDDKMANEAIKEILKNHGDRLHRVGRWRQ